VESGSCAERQSLKLWSARNIAQNQADIRTDRTDIAQDKANVRANESNIAQNRADIRTDANNIRTDRQDLRADHQDLRANGQDVRTAAAAQPQRVAQVDSKPGSPPVNGAKPQLTANTLANNAAANSKKAQTDETTHKAWYHWVW
jgi:hypothetical protein